MNFRTYKTRAPIFASAAILAGVAAGTFASPASAEIIDPSTYHVGAGATSPSATGLGQDPNQIGTGSNFDIFQNANGNVAGTSPLLLIFAVPDNAGAPSISSTGTLYRPFPGAPDGTITINQTLGYGLGGYVQGSNFSSGDLYTFLSTKSTDPVAAAAFAAGNNSFNITNMNTAELQDNSLIVLSYDVYLWQANTDMLPNDLLDVTGNTLPFGTFISAFSEELATCPSKNQGFDNCAPVVVPFTESGLTTTRPGDTGHQGEVPEPASLAMLGAALVAFAGFGAVRRRRWRS